MKPEWRFTSEDETSVCAAFEDGHCESHSIDAGVIQAWLSEGNTPLPYESPEVDAQEEAKAELSETDSEIARVAEDLIQTLISRGVIAESDIPESAHDKMARRAKLRARLA